VAASRGGVEQLVSRESRTKSQRLQVFFGARPAAGTEISVTTVLCDECGFTYLPRPDKAAIDAKYRFLTNLDPEPGARPQRPRKSGNGGLSFIVIFEVAFLSSPSLGGHQAGAGWALCIRAVGKRGARKRRAPAEARRRLTPGISLKLKRRLLMPHTISISGVLRRQLSRLAARG
jgi:hypothetical protein